MRTREKSNEKHPEKKSEDFFPSTSGVKTISDWSSAAQIHALTGLGDSDLRRLANPNNPSPTGEPWFPKPRAGRYATIPTLAGLARYYRHQAERTRADHPGYASMEELDHIGLVPIEAQKFASRQGVKFINPNRSVQSEPVRRWLVDILRKLFSKNGPNLKEIQGLEIWDKDTEMAKKLREDRIKLEDERETRRGTLVDKEYLDELIYEQWLGPARAQIESGQKNLKRQIRTILAGDGSLAEKIAKLETAVTATTDATLKKMSDQIPKK